MERALLLSWIGFCMMVFGLWMCAILMAEYAQVIELFSWLINTEIENWMLLVVFIAWVGLTLQVLMRDE